MAADEYPNLCPKCGSPREPGAPDCGFCGIIFDRYDPSRHPPPVWQQTVESEADPAQNPIDPEWPDESPPQWEAEAPAGRPPATSGASPPRPLPRTAHDRFLASIEDKILAPLALVALLLNLAVAAAFSTWIMGASDEHIRMRDIHRAAVGRPIPGGLDEGAAAWFVGRQMLFIFDQSQGLFYFLYYEGALAKHTEPDEIKRTGTMLLDETGIPWSPAGTVAGVVADQAVTIDRLTLEASPNSPPARAYFAAFTTSEGRTVCLFFMGAEKPATALAQELFGRVY